MLSHFPVVALVDEYEKSLSVMEASMPDYFRGARDSYREAIKGERGKFTYTVQLPIYGRMIVSFRDKREHGYRIVIGHLSFFG